jgi:hypothetical protein
LKSLSNDSLALEDAPASAEGQKPSRKTGYNPYDVDGPAGKPQSSKTKASKARK